MDNRPIGIFDSGVGGLTVLKQVMKVMPNENTIYFGDTARVPYGSKSKETVYKFSGQIIRFLKTKDVKAIIIACNTVSSNCYEALCKDFPDIKIIDVVSPGVESCLEATQSGVVGVIGTESTIKSGAYENQLKKFRSDIEVHSKACPLFVPLAEEGWVDNEIAALTIKEYLKEPLSYGIDSLILGCTHYPLFKKCIASLISEDIRLVDPAKATALKMQSYLMENDLLSSNEVSQVSHEFYVSDNYLKFENLCTRILNQNYTSRKIDIDNY